VAVVFVNGLVNVGMPSILNLIFIQQIEIKLQISCWTFCFQE